VVEARPPSAGYRIAKFVRRHRGAVAAASLIVLALVGGIAGTTFGLVRANRARAEAVEHAERERLAKLDAEAARDRATAAEKAEAVERAQAEKNAQLAGVQATLALNTIQDMIVQVQTKLNEPNLFDIKTALLDTALKRVDGVASGYAQSTSKEATVLAALNELARIYRELGQSERAFRILERCLEIAKERVRIKEGSDPARQNLANINRELAVISQEFRRDMKASLAYNQESLHIWEDVFKNPKPDQWRLDKKIVRIFLAEAYMRVGVDRYRAGDIEAARQDYLKGYELRHELVAENPKDLTLQQDLSYSTMALAEAAFRRGQRDQAEEYYRLTLAQRQKMAEAKPKDTKVREELAAVYYMIGVFKLRSGDLAAAQANLERCREIRKALVDADPRNAISRRNLATVLYPLAVVAELQKNAKGARELLESARELQQKLVNDDRENLKRQYELMKTLARLGQVPLAVEIADRLAAGVNVDNEMLLEIAYTYAQCARHAQGGTADAHLTSTVAAVGKAIANGFNDHVTLSVEPDLEPVRGRADFKALLAKLAPGTRATGGAPKSAEPGNE
jgi:tetratricopeptide (TPR) repeat protein